MGNPQVKSSPGVWKKDDQKGFNPTLNIRNSDPFTGSAPTNCPKKSFLGRYFSPEFIRFPMPWSEFGNLLKDSPKTSWRFKILHHVPWSLMNCKEEKPPCHPGTFLENLANEVKRREMLTKHAWGKSASKRKRDLIFPPFFKECLPWKEEANSQPFGMGKFKANPSLILGTFL